MKRVVFRCVLLYFVSFGVACQDTQPPPEKATPSLPNTPVEVAQEWVEAFYKDDFKKAIELGTDNTRQMIDSVKVKLIPDAINVAFTISDMICETKADSSFCTYTYEEDFEKYEEYVSLRKVNGQWLVDAPWEEASEEELEMEEFIREEMNKMFEDAENG